MSKKKLIIILIFTFFTIRIVFNLFANILLMLIQPNFEQYVQDIQLRNNGQLVDNPVLQVLSFTLIASFMSPVLEELVYRSWLTKKINTIKAISYLVFLVILGQQLLGFTPLYRPVINLISYFTTNYINFFTNLYPPITYSIFNTGKMSILALFLPLFILTVYLINFISLKSKNKSFTARLEKFLGTFSPTLLIFFSAIVFYESHGRYFSLNLSGPEEIASSIGALFVFIVALALGYIARNYSLKLCMYLHILVNFTTSIRFFQNLQTLIAISLYTTYFVIFTTILYLIYREIKFLRVKSKLEVAQTT
jgi:Type II CAAX prenyl endopeptidase Rce1-like